MIAAFYYVFVVKFGRLAKFEFIGCYRLVDVSV